MWQREGMWGWALSCKNTLEDDEESSDCILWAQGEILECLHWSRLST